MSLPAAPVRSPAPGAVPAATSAANLSANPESMPVRRVVQVYKNHLDVGFTEMAAKVTHDAIHWMMGVAADTARRLREERGKRSFVWTVPAWLAHEALEILDGDALRKIERALAEGDISWHALPFTTHTELMDEELCAFGCELSRRLDRRFGIITRAAKLTDVPGHTRGLVGVLARCGIEFLHIGVNPMSPSPVVPPAFRWRDALGNELVVAYEPGYANAVRLPGDDQVLQWRFVGDNMEVPSTHDIRADIADAEARYPGAEIVAGRMDDWAAGIVARAAGLPVVELEIGDSWIHGTGTDPRKTTRFRALQRLRTDWLRDGRLARDGAAWLGFSKNMLLVPEHTWGVSFSGHTHHDRTHWDNGDFARVRHRGCFRGAEASWQEQRDYLELAVEALEPPLKAEAEAALLALSPAMTNTNAWQVIDPGAGIHAGDWRMRLDAAHGGVSSLIGADGADRVAPGGHLARLRYQTFDDADCRRFVAQYCTGTGEWLLEEFTKLGLKGTTAVSRWWDPMVASVRRRDAADRVEIAIGLRFAEAAVELAGAPAEAQLLISLPLSNSRTCGRMDARVAWTGKGATRLPEAMWWSFQPRVADPSRWRFEKLGQLVDPTAVAARGGRPLHGVGRGALNDDGRERLELLTPDAHLIAPGRPQLYEFTDEHPDLAGGLHLNLVNNLWGTNFPMWCGDDLAFRASLAWMPSSGADRSGTGAATWDGVTSPR